MRKLLKSLGALLLVVIMLVSAVSCSNSSSGSSAASSGGGAAGSGGSASEPEENTDPIRIGLACALSGASAAYGNYQYWAANLAAEEINEAGGVNGRMVEIVALDDANDATQAPIVAQQFCDDPTIVGVIAHGGSACTAASQPIFEEAGLLNVAPASSSNYLSTLGFSQWMRIVVSDIYQAPRIAAFIRNNLGLDSAAVVYANTDAGVGILENVKAVSDGLGLSIVAEETYNPGTESDFSTLITKVKSTNPKSIIVQGTYQDLGVVMRQLHEMGMDVPIVGLSSLTYRATIDLAGVDAVQQMYCVCTFNPFSENELNKNFMANYTAEFGADQIPSSPCGLTYDAVYVICEAVRQGATRENIADWIMNRIPGNEPFVMEDMLLGPNITWSENGDVSSFTCSVVKVDESGNFVAFEDVDETNLVIPE